jgi:hypothetical protein
MNDVMIRQGVSSTCTVQLEKLSSAKIPQPDFPCSLERTKKSMVKVRYVHAKTSRSRTIGQVRLVERLMSNGEGGAGDRE